MTFTLRSRIAFEEDPFASSPTWTDVTNDLRADGQLVIVRGRTRELADVTESSAEFGLKNHTGKYTAGLTSSPYYPHVVDGRRCDHAIIRGGVTYPRWTGFVNRFPVVWQSDIHAISALAATDRFKRLGEQHGPLGSFLSEEILIDEPLAHYPLSEPSGSTSAGDVSGTTAGPISQQQAGGGGTLEFGQDDVGPTGTGVGAPVFTPSGSNLGKYLRGDLGPDFEADSSIEFIFVELWFSTSTQGRVAQAVTSSDLNYQLLIGTESGTGKLRIQSGTAGSITTATVWSSSPNLADGEIHHVVYDEGAQKVYIDGVDTGTGSVHGMLHLRTLTVGGFNGTQLHQGVISHVALYARSGLAASDLTPHYTTGSTGDAGERTDQRIARIAGYAGVATADQSLDTGLSVVASQSGSSKTPLESIREVARLEAGLVFMGRDGKLVFHGRGRRYTATSAFTLSAKQHISPDFGVAQDDELRLNDVTGSRPGGAAQRVRNQASRDRYGRYADSFDIPATTDVEVAAAARWRVNRFGDRPPRVEQVTVNVAKLPDALAALVLAADVSTVFTITDLPDNAPSSSLVLVVEGYREVIDPGANTHSITFYTSPADLSVAWQLGVVGASELGLTTRVVY